MALKKDKQKVLGEVFDNDRVRTFLIDRSPKGVNVDFHCLERAYRGMNLDNFSTFVGFFLEAKRDINATNPKGRTLVSLIDEHSSFTEFKALLVKHGAEC